MVLVATAALQSMCHKLNLSKVLRINPTHPAKASFTLFEIQAFDPRAKRIFLPALFASPFKGAIFNLPRKKYFSLPRLSRPTVAT